MAVTKEDLARAEAAMATLRRSTARAVAARYDRRIGRVVIRLSSGLEVAFSARDVQGLEHARSADFDTIEISPRGLGLHFPKLDADVYVPALLQGFTGSKQWMAAHAVGRADRKAGDRTRRTTVRA
jgi:hypothetical protein